MRHERLDQLVREVGSCSYHKTANMTCMHAYCMSHFQCDYVRTFLSVSEIFEFHTENHCQPTHGVHHSEYDGQHFRDGIAVQCTHLVHRNVDSFPPSRVIDGKCLVSNA